MHLSGRLTKHHGLGNDFLVLIDQPGDADLARRLCDRRRGIGADGLIVANTVPAGDADLSMELYNADGSRAEMSGNGIRCLAQAEAMRRGTPAADLTIATDVGTRAVAVRPGAEPHTSDASVDMGKILPGPERDREVPPPPPDQALVAKRRELALDVGNPHVVYLVDDVATVVLEAEGPHYERAYSHGINVEFIAPSEGRADALDLRVWERGAGITEACGTGACAAAHAANQWGQVGERVRVHMPGGDVDVILGDTVTLVGPITFVAHIELGG